MAYDLISKSQKGRDWSCSIGASDAEIKKVDMGLLKNKWFWLMFAGSTMSVVGQRRPLSRPLLYGGLAVAGAGGAMLYKTSKEGV